MKKAFCAVLSLILLFGIIIMGGAEVKREDIKEVGVHDPSIIKDSNGKYYVFGSHITTAVSDDMIDWNYVARGYKKEENVHFGNLSDTLAESFKWAGEDDGDCAGGYAVWAPDVYYNKDYVWEDRSRGAYMMYYSVSSTYKRSAIGLAVSKTIEGPYEYVDTVIYSGFTKIDSKDENSLHNNIYTNTNLDNLISKGRVCAYKDDWGIEDYNNITYPNAIDPCIYEDENGKLYMAYGSWSGGIFALPLNKINGLPIYPCFDSKTADGRMIDRYFGTHIAGGKGFSGEGPFVYYDEQAGYYYLQSSYDWLGTDGGYHIRMFRSTAPDGPFTDASGNSAVFGEIQAEHGVKMFGNYYFSDLATPYTSGGHCSTLIDNDGKRYVFYHTRFKNSESFRLRVHEMFINEDGWCVVAPYRYMGNTDEAVTDKEVCGTYEFINHGIGIGEGTHVNAAMTVSLDRQGRVTGAQNGTWSMNGNLCTLVLDGITYKGVFLKQQNEKNEPVTVFTAVGDNNASVWGVMLNKKEDAPKADAIISFDEGLKTARTVVCKNGGNPVRADVEPIYEPGIKGNAIRLDGSYGMEITDVNLNFDATISFYIKLDHLANYTPIVATSGDFSDSGFDKWFSLTTLDNGKSACLWSHSAETGQWFTTEKKDAYSMGSWQHITLVFDRNYYGGEKEAVAVRLYVNGHNVAIGGASKGAFNAQSKLYIGINPWDELLHAAIDEIQIFDKALSHGEVISLYES